MAKLAGVRVQPEDLDFKKLSHTELAAWYKRISAEVADRYGSKEWVENADDFSNWADEQRALGNECKP